MKSWEEGIISEEEIEQKILEWLQKEFKPEEVKRFEKYIPTVKNN